MTNTLHRRGSEDELRRDFVLFCMPTRSITPELPAKLRRFTEIALAHKPVSANRLEGRSVTAIDLTRIEEELEEGFCLHAVFDDVEALAGAVRDLVEADLGLPINVSGPLAEVESCCRRAGITRHSVEQSLGTRGRVDRLPRPEVVELNSLCGHGLVGHNLIEASGRPCADRAHQCRGCGAAPGAALSVRLLQPDACRRGPGASSHRGLR